MFSLKLFKKHHVKVTLKSTQLTGKHYKIIKGLNIFKRKLSFFSKYSNIF